MCDICQGHCVWVCTVYCCDIKKCHIYIAYITLHWYLMILPRSDIKSFYVGCVVCICICIFSCICVYMYVYVCIGIYVYIIYTIHVCLCVCLCAHVYIGV